MGGKGKEVEVKKSKSEAPAETGNERLGYPLLGLRDEIDRVFDRFFGEGAMTLAPPLRRAWDWGAFGATASDLMSAPRADFSESNKEYELTVELPGLDEKQIDVTVSNGAITVAGERKDERETKQKNYHLTERSYGSVRRTFPLPPGADAARVTATFAKGVLTVRLPKTEEARSKPHKIEVKSA